MSLSKIYETVTVFNNLNFLLLCKVCYFRAHNILETNDNVTTIMNDIHIKINTLDVVVKLPPHRRPPLPFPVERWPDQPPPTVWLSWLKPVHHSINL